MSCGGPGLCGHKEHCLDGHCPGHPDHPSNRWGAGRDVPDDSGEWAWFVIATILALFSVIAIVSCGGPK